MPLSSSHNRQIFIIILIGLWLVGLLGIASWFQSHFVKPFSMTVDANSSTNSNIDVFLNPESTKHWFSHLNSLLPPKQKGSRLIQFWKPGCLCNRFAHPHAIDATTLAETNNVEHITLIPKDFEEELEDLVKINPGTRIITLDRQLLASWPNSPSVFIEDALGSIRYFGPLGFGAFCTSPSVSLMAQQIEQLKTENAQPFFNVVGKGCFCHWGSI